MFFLAMLLAAATAAAMERSIELRQNKIVDENIFE